MNVGHLPEWEYLSIGGIFPDCWIVERIGPLIQGKHRALSEAVVHDPRKLIPVHRSSTVKNKHKGLLPSYSLYLAQGGAYENYVEYREETGAGRRQKALAYESRVQFYLGLAPALSVDEMEYLKKATLLINIMLFKFAQKGSYALHVEGRGTVEHSGIDHVDAN